MSEATPLNPLYFKLFDVSGGKGDVKRLQIINAFLKSVDKRGIEATSFPDLAKDLKTNHSHISYYFPSKLDLFDAALKWIHGNMQAQIVEALAQESEPRAQLRAYTHAIFKCLDDNPSFGPTFMLSFHYCNFDKTYADIYARFVKAAEERMLAILRSANENKKVSGAQLIERAEDLHALLMGSVVRYIVGKQAPTARRRIAKRLEAFAFSSFG